ncbi:MAG: ribonuclease P protein component [Leptolyngbyaceae cyanobacterium bins.349]|nr:ribonuclease P protein component [Leptolyngbyaceae cyanobacterium bins.349]
MGRSQAVAIGIIADYLIGRETVNVGLPKHHRLKRRDDFSRVYQKGSRFKTEHLTLRVLQRNRTAITDKLSLRHSADAAIEPSLRALPTRIGTSISLKVDKRAVVRNRIRRQLQAAFRQLLPQIAANCDLLVVVHPQAVQCDYFQFLQELEQLLIKAEVFDGNPGRCVL